MGATCLPGPPLAQGSTVQIRPSRAALAGAAELAYTAAPGEQNRMLIRSPSMADATWVVNDPGAVISPGPGCASVDPHTVRCDRVQDPNPLMSAAWLAHVQLGDLDDEVRIQSEPQSLNRELVADGGPGNDVLVGGAGWDRLDGGPGRDVLRGGAGLDQLLDPGPTEDDVLDGGAGEDAVSYQGRTAAVTVDLSRKRGGEAGERDSISSVESATGGRGADLLIGSDKDNTLDGGGGPNRMEGLAGNDQFANGRGPIVCGPGSDSIRDPSRDDFLEPDCDRVSFGEDVELEAQPVVRGRSLVYRPRCPGTGAGPAFRSCTGTLLVRERRGRHRLLARKRLPERRWGERRIRARFSETGRRLAARPLGVRVSVSIVGRGWAGVRWTTRLVSRRP
jgi:hypothetical protein